MGKKVLKNIFIYGFSIVCILPFIIMICYSFKGVNGGFSLAQYGMLLFQREDFFTGFWNTVIYTVVIISVNIPLSLLTAYGFTCFDFKGKGFIYWLYIVLMMMPFQATIVPQYLTLKALHIIDSPLAVILPNIFSTFGTFLMTQYMKGLNKEIFYAGIIDGLSEMKLFLLIAIPICRPVISALTVLLFINYWSMIEQPLIFISNFRYMPLSVTLNSAGSFKDISFAAGSVFSILPILLYQFSYSDFTKGISLSTGAETSSWNSEEKGIKQRKKIKKLMVIFMLAMSFLTLATQKITYVMRPEVEVLRIKSSDLKSDPYDKKSESLGYFEQVIPSGCIHAGGSENYVFSLVQDKENRDRKQIMKITVQIQASNGIETAVSSSLSGGSDIIKWSTKPLCEGMTVNVVGGENEN